MQINNITEIVKQKKKKNPKLALYLLPNLMTASSLLCGFLSIKFSFDGRLLNNNIDLSIKYFVFSAVFILCATIFDGLDGSIARLTKTQSSFGVQFDSLCDLVSFGVAPAILAYQFALHELNNLGLAVAFSFTLCGAMRLARFNVQSSQGKANGNFTGIPIPMGAAPIAVVVLNYENFIEYSANNNNLYFKYLSNFMFNPTNKAVIFFIITIILALGMISTFEYLSHKSIKLPKKHPFRTLATVLIILTLLFGFQLRLSLAILLIAYCIHGPILYILYKRDKAGGEEELFISSQEEDDDNNEDEHKE